MYGQFMWFHSPCDKWKNILIQQSFSNVEKCLQILRILHYSTTKIRCISDKRNFADSWNMRCVHVYVCARSISLTKQQQVKSENAVCHRSSVIVCSWLNEHVYYIWHSNCKSVTRVCIYTAIKTSKLFIMVEKIEPSFEKFG